MNIISLNPGHDGAIACLKDAHLLFSIEAEKNSNYRYSPISSHDVFNVLANLTKCPTSFVQAVGGHAKSTYSDRMLLPGTVAY